MTERNRLRWRCRRGMLELDLLLQGFLERGYDSLRVVELEAFNQLLEYPDSVLLDALMGHMVPANKDIARVVEKIRRAVVP